MTNEDMLAKLMAQASTQGSDLITLRAIVEESSELGANRVLNKLGLEDDDAHQDLNELRELLAAWRAAKTSASKAAIEWMVRAVMALLLIGIAVRLGVSELLR
ncbi:DUF6127 family protein [Alteraurantiacibacter aquimixticola]|uniref:Uncharacterized protein n=1 Tax=Alteraurantiacibacter aquimixticola TaxID=2489173 RepID=A0A4T3EXS5_9SPHN|nr:DUF6127 family protein [Alteraurantiacibacter aquimixticola]TIX49386.1 hypothetical protein E5222_11040 [Alteraurantiacibacter aquimixticola]